MKETVRFLLKKFPTGDCNNQCPESDYDEAGSDSDEDENLAAAVAGATSRVNATKKQRRPRRDGSDSEYNSAEHEEEDDTLDGFIVGDDVEESDSGSEYGSDVDNGERCRPTRATDAI
jgi:hypothetical protein